MPAKLFIKGNPGKAPGTLNKTTKLVKEVFAETFSELQKDPKANLQKWAKENPTEFYKLSSKLIPIQLAGDPDNPVSFNPLQGLTFDQIYQLKYGTKPE